MKEGRLAESTAQIMTELSNNPKVATGLSAYILSVNWIDFIPEFFKYASSIVAFIALILVIRNHLLTHKKLKLEIEKLEGQNDASEEG